MSTDMMWIILFKDKKKSALICGKKISENQREIKKYLKNKNQFQEI